MAPAEASGPQRPAGAGDRRHGTGLRNSRVWPPNWPIRWKLSAVSAGLTFLILVTFGIIVGQLAVKQLRDNFEADTVAKAEDLAGNLQRSGAQILPAAVGPRSVIDQILKSTSGVPELITTSGLVVKRPNQAFLGPLQGDQGVATLNGFQIATVPYYDRRSPDVPVAWVRYGRPIARLDLSESRIWFAILAGILGATLLAALGAVILSRRAMRPITTLTTTAREIARTRDPEVRLEPPVSDDEVAELTRTFSEMLHELTLSRSEEERLLRRQREFVADASHELRTPLTSVLANLEILEESLNPTGRSDDLDAVASALRSSRRMRRLVSDLQLLARIDVLREAAFEPCDLARIAADAVGELDPLLGSRRLELEAGKPVMVQGAADELHRIAVNLIGNAIRHTPANARISVRATADEKAAAATLSVEDDGPGIPPELRSGIFDRFVRGAAPIDRSGGKGTGLGLAIVKAIAERHRGEVTVGDSELGGARFAVILPVNRAADGRSGSGRRERERREGDRREGDRRSSANR